MDAGNHQLLVNSPSYNTFLLTIKNCKLQIQRKIQVLFVYHVFASHVPASPGTCVPASPSPCVSRPGVPESHVPVSPSPTSRRPRVLASRRPRPTFSHSHSLRLRRIIVNYLSHESVYFIHFIPGLYNICIFPLHTVEALSPKRPPPKFKKVVATRAGRLQE